MSLPKREGEPVVEQKQTTPPRQEEKTTPTSGFTVPTEIVDLPSKGLLYPASHPQSSGQIEMKVMTAKEEDILTNQSFIRKGTVIDELLKSLIVSEVDYDSLLAVDIEALMIAARIMGYGPDYSFEVTTPSGNKQVENVDLTQFEDKEFDESLITKGVNSFSYQLPLSKWDVTFKLLTKADDDQMNKVQDAYQKAGKTVGGVTLLLKMLIQSINGVSDKRQVGEMIDAMRASDARALRKYITSVQPGVDLSMEIIDRQTGDPFRTSVQFGPQFLWPDFEG